MKFVRLMNESKIDVLIVDETPLAPSSGSDQALDPVLDQSKSQSETDLDESPPTEPSVPSPLPHAEPVFVPVTFEDPENEQPVGTATPDAAEMSESRCCLLM
jgi:hypothetical protein